MTTDQGWDATARGLGARSDGRFNAATAPITNPRALVWGREDGEVESISGGELTARARRIATVLRRSGVGAGDRVPGLMGRRPEAYAVPLAVWPLRGIFVPLFSGFRRDALEVRLTDSGATAIVSDPENRPSLDGLEESRSLVLVGGRPESGEVDLDRELIDAPEEPTVAETCLGDPSTVTYTSGTSGRPKGCVIPHRAVINLAPFVTSCFGLGRGDLLFSTADTGWSFGLFTTGFAPMCLGSSRLLYEGAFDAAAWWATIERLGVTHFASAPTGFRQLALAGADLVGAADEHLRAATAAGEALDPEAIRWFEETLGLTIHDAYGLTELGMVIADPRGPGAPGPSPRSMGFPVPGFEVRLVDDDGRVVATGDVGRVAVRDNGWLLSSTYWRREEEWNDRLRDGWWLTEDCARQDEDGRYWYLGRNDDVIVAAGYNIGPVEVEAVLMEHPVVAEAACVGQADARKGQVVAAHVVVSDEPPDDLADQLRAIVGERIGWHAAPRHVHVHESLPRTESGKMRRQHLRETGGPSCGPAPGAGCRRGHP